MPGDATGLGLEPLCFLGLFVLKMATMMKSAVIHTVIGFHPTLSLQSMDKFISQDFFSS